MTEYICFFDPLPLPQLFDPGGSFSQRPRPARLPARLVSDQFYPRKIHPFLVQGGFLKTKHFRRYLFMFMIIANTSGCVGATSKLFLSRILLNLPVPNVLVAEAVLKIRRMRMAEKPLIPENWSLVFNTLQLYREVNEKFVYHTEHYGIFFKICLSMKSHFSVTSLTALYFHILNIKVAKTTVNKM